MLLLDVLLSLLSIIYEFMRVFFFHMFVDTDTNTDIEMNDLFSFYSSAVSGSILFNSVSVGCCHVLLAINSSC